MRIPVLLLLVSTISMATTSCGDTSHAAADPKLLFRRGWFDKYPENARTEIRFAFFTPGGFAFFDQGSGYRYATDIADFERAGNKLDLEWMQDKKKVAITYEVKRCDDDPAFDLCLDLSEPLGGTKRYRSWGDDDEDGANNPWIKALRETARARAEGLAGK